MIVNHDPQVFERQKLLVNRLYDKFDYHKAARLRVPSYVAIANFGLLILSTRAVIDSYTIAIFVFGFAVIGIVGAYALWVVRAAFVKNIEELDYLYDQLELKQSAFQDKQTGSLAEPASPLWSLLFLLIFLSFFLPSVLLFFVDFLPVLPRI